MRVRLGARVRVEVTVGSGSGIRRSPAEAEVTNRDNRQQAEHRQQAQSGNKYIVINLPNTDF